MEKHNLKELAFQNKRQKIRLKKFSPQEISEPSAVIEEESVVSRPEEITISPETEIIKSPIVGVFYTSPAPKSPPFVQVGDLVEEGTTLCIIEAMKVLNEIKTDKKCKIERVLVNNGEVVKLDQPLFSIIPL